MSFLPAREASWIGIEFEATGSLRLAWLGPTAIEAPWPSGLYYFHSLEELDDFWEIQIIQERLHAVVAISDRAASSDKLNVLAWMREHGHVADMFSAENLWSAFERLATAYHVPKPYHPCYFLALAALKRDRAGQIARSIADSIQATRRDLEKLEDSVWQLAGALPVLKRP